MLLTAASMAAAALPASAGAARRRPGDCRRPAAMAGDTRIDRDAIGTDDAGGAGGERAVVARTVEGDGRGNGGVSFSQTMLSAALRQLSTCNKAAAGRRPRSRIILELWIVARFTQLITESWSKPLARPSGLFKSTWNCVGLERASCQTRNLHHDGVHQPLVIAVILHNQRRPHFGRRSTAERKIYQCHVAPLDVHSFPRESRAS